MFEDKAIPTRPFVPGATTVRDRDGADLTLSQNEIKINTLGDVSSILVANSVEVELPSKNQTTYSWNTNSNYTIPNLKPTISETEIDLLTLNKLSQNIYSKNYGQLTADQQKFVKDSLFTYSTSTILPINNFSELPTTENPLTLPDTATQPAAEIYTIEYSSNLLPAQDSEFTDLYDDNIQEIAQDTGYIALNTDIVLLEITAGRKANGYYTAAVSYDKLTSLQKQNVAYVIEAAKYFKVSEIETKAMLSIMSKEGGFKETVEYSYCKTTAERLKNEIFTKILRNYTEAQINAVKCDNEKFYNIIYGGRYENNTTTDGYKYRGRGFNGITFKAGYKAVQNLYNAKGKPLGEIDIVNKPESLEKNYKLMAYLSVLSFLENKKYQPTAAKANKTLEDWILFYIRLNAGWGNSITQPTIAEGLAQAQAFGKTLPSTIY